MSTMWQDTNFYITNVAIAQHTNVSYIKMATNV